MTGNWPAFSRPARETRARARLRAGRDDKALELAEVLVREGSHGDRIYEVDSGEIVVSCRRRDNHVEVAVRDINGKEYEVGPGSIIYAPPGIAGSTAKRKRMPRLR